MIIEFNKNQFACNFVSENEATDTYPHLQKNCSIMKNFEDSQRSELSYIDATNVQQRTWLQIFNLAVGSILLMYGTSKVL